MLWGKREGQAIENDDGKCANGIRKAISDEIISDQICEAKVMRNIWGKMILCHMNSKYRVLGKRMCLRNNAKVGIDAVKCDRKRACRKWG